MECLIEKPPQSINAGHTSSSAASRLVHKENPNAKKTQAATRIPSKGHNQSQFEAESLVEPVSITNSPVTCLVGAPVNLFSCRAPARRSMEKARSYRHAPQSQSVSHDRDRAETHCRSGDNWAQENSERGV